MQRLVRLAPALLLVAAAPATTPTAPRGFFPENAAAEAKAEREFRAIPDPAVARESMRQLSAVPHNLGSPGGAKNAEWILARFKEWGLDAHIETFDVLFPTPRERVVELLEPVAFRASLAETPLKDDPTSGQTAQQLPTYNAYSVDGDVTAPLVYVNYGVPEDYEKLERLGVDVHGQDRHRPLRRRLARDQAEGRGGERRHRLHHLLGPARRRLLRGRGVSEGPLPAGAGRPARQRRGHAAVLGRPADSGDRSDEGRQTDRPQGRADDHEDPRAPDLLRRREAAARGARRADGAGGMARRAADHVSDRAGAREGPLEARLRLEARPRQRRHREDRGLGVAG